jgi:hypothetical protein
VSRARLQLAQLLDGHPAARSLAAAPFLADAGQPQTRRRSGRAKQQKRPAPERPAH